MYAESRSTASYFRDNQANWIEEWRSLDKVQPQALAATSIASLLAQKVWSVHRLHELYSPIFFFIAEQQRATRPVNRVHYALD